MDKTVFRGTREIHSYVIRGGRMSKLHQKAYDELGPKYCIPYEEQLIDLKKYFPKGEIILEIGFGMGLATAAIADKNRDKNYLGIEVHKPGVGKLLSEIGIRNLDNMRIINFDAVKVIDNMIPDGSFDGIHIFFPDPWPKKKHHKRRLVQAPFIKKLLPKLKNDGYIYCVTDWEEYGEQMLEVLISIPELKNQYEDWANQPVWRPETRFERKGLDKSYKIREVFFRKLISQKN
ncbi:MAG: tRNA (guanosine(46)-N7)-methyltransferase TrmB [Spirochaetales bacterium]|nr:tRNA (guanosine(46)-N7)-methyltransferase TrmB [Spirochaetales bacterium]